MLAEKKPHKGLFWTIAESMGPCACPRDWVKQLRNKEHWKHRHEDMDQKDAHSHQDIAGKDGRCRPYDTETEGLKWEDDDDDKQNQEVIIRKSIFARNAGLARLTTKDLGRTCILSHSLHRITHSLTVSILSSP